MVPLMSDAKVVFLIWFVGVALIVAVALISVEIWLKRKKERVVEKRRKKTPIDKMKISLGRAGDVKKKFEIISKTAKDFFKQEYGVPLKLDYSGMAKKFEQEKKLLESSFCKKMFEFYYSDKKISDEQIDELVEILVEIQRKKTVSKNLSKVPGFWDRFDSLFDAPRKFIFDKINAYTSSQKEKQERISRINAKREHEFLIWVRRAISLGHDRKAVYNLLNDGKRSKKELKRIMEIYDKELLQSKKPGNKLSSVSSGIAQRIIQEEKEKAEKLGVLN